jgi:hypothetical protein
MNQPTYHYEQNGYKFDIYFLNNMERIKITTDNGIVLNMEQVFNENAGGINYRQVPKGCFFRSQKHILLVTYEQNIGKYRYLQIKDGYDYSEDYDLTMEQLFNMTALLVEIPNIPKEVFYRTMLVADIDTHENFPEYNTFVDLHGAEHGYIINEQGSNIDPMQSISYNNTNNNNNNPTLNGGKRKIKKTRKNKKIRKSMKTKRH